MTDQELRDKLAREYAFGDTDLCHFVDFKAGWDAARANPLPTDKFKSASFIAAKAYCESKPEHTKEQTLAAVAAFGHGADWALSQIQAERDKLRAELNKEKAIKKLFKDQSERYAKTAVEAFEQVSLLSKERDQLRDKFETLEYEPQTLAVENTLLKLEKTSLNAEKDQLRAMCEKLAEALEQIAINVDANDGYTTMDKNKANKALAEYRTKKD